MFASLDLHSCLAGSLMAFAVGVVGLMHGEPGDSAPAPMEPAARAVMEPAITPFATPSTSGRKVTRSADGMFYITCMIDGKPVRFLVDTGASVTVLTEQDASLVAASLDAETGESSLSTVGGQASARQGQLDGLVIAGRKLPPIRVAVLSTGINVSLLGQNALSKLGPITFDKDVMTLR